jgi:hypothetical protein
MTSFLITWLSCGVARGGLSVSSSTFAILEPYACCVGTVRTVAPVDYQLDGLAGDCDQPNLKPYSNSPAVSL